MLRWKIHTLLAMLLFASGSITTAQQPTSKSLHVRELPAAPMLDQNDMASSLEEALSHDKYPTYEQYDSMMHFFAKEYPEICAIDTIGESIQGRLLLVLKISDNVKEEEDEPSFLYTSTIHGNELVGYNLSLRFIDFLLQNYPADPEVERLVNDVELWINPLSNPDGTYYPDNNSSVASSRRNNVNGYDLNRDYPDPKAGDANDTAGVQQENQYMMRFMNKHMFNLSANLHAGAEVVNYPWDHTYSLHPDDDWFYMISREYADEATAFNPAYMGEFTDGVTNGAQWYVITGGRQDYVTYYLHGREVTLELSNTKLIESENLETYWSYNQRSLLNYAGQARFGIHGKVISNVSETPVSAKIVVSAHDDSTSWVQSDSIFGSFYRYLKEGIYDLVVSADGYKTDTVKEVQVFDYRRTDLTVRLDSTGKSNGFLSGKIDGIPAFSIYPNPVSGTLFVEQNNTNPVRTEYALYHVSGQMMLKGLMETGTGKTLIDLSPLTPGIYLLHLRSPDNNQVNRIIVL